MIIRQAQPNDLPDLAHLWRERMTILSQSDPRFAFDERDYENWQHQISAYLSGDRESLVLLAQTENPIGYVVGVLAGERGEIHEIALDAHTYHSGLGRALWQEIKAWFDENKVISIIVQVPRYHAVEQAFWRALGAKTAPQSPDSPPEWTWLTL